MNNPVIKINTALHILVFKYHDITVSWGISEKFKEFKISSIYSDGNIEFMTNNGIESIDIIDGSEDMYTKRQLADVKQLFRSKEKRSIVLRVEQ